jgi:uncharacterized repeat protein (TIGR01451 family)
LSDTDTVSITIGPDARANLEVSIDVPSIVEVGGTLAYAIRVTNHGPMAASTVTLVDALPIGITPVSVSAERGACSTTFGFLVRCDLGAIAVRQSVAVTIVINVLRQGTLSNRATVVANQLDPVIANNSTTARTVAFIELSSHVTIESLSGGAGSERVFKIDVPPGQGGLTAIGWGGTGFSLGLNHATPAQTGGGIAKSINNPVEGPWFVTVFGVTAYSGVSLQARFSADTTPFLVNGLPVTSISGARSSQRHWRIAVPPGATLTVAIAGSNGDADLYVKHASVPTTASYNCRGIRPHSFESCRITNVSEGDWYVMVYGFQAYSGVTLRTDYVSAP